MLAKLCHATSFDIVGVSFVGFNGLVVDAALVLRHQNIVLFPLLVCFHLRVQRVEVLALGVLALLLLLTFLIFTGLNILGDLIGVNGISLPH